jgi:hypothetical protein
MKARGAAVQGALAVAGLTAAYFAWQREPVTSGSEVTILDLGKNAISTLTYDDTKQHVVFVRGEEGGEPLTWFTVTPKEPPPPPPVPAKDGGAADGGALVSMAAVDAGTASAVASSSPPKKPRQFRGNEQADKVWERFAPLHGTRALGVLDAVKLKEVGLDKADRFLTLSTNGGTYDFEVGTVAQGVVNPYFRDRKDGRVYLVKGNLLSDLEFAQSRLVDRRLHAFKQEEADGLTVKAGTVTKDFVVADGKVSPKDSPSAPDAFAKNWSDKLFRIVVTEVLGKDELPPAGAPLAELRVEYTHHGKSVGWMEVGHSGPDFYARTEHTAGWLKVPANTTDLVVEAHKVITGT